MKHILILTLVLVPINLAIELSALRFFFSQNMDCVCKFVNTILHVLHN